MASVNKRTDRSGYLVRWRQDGKPRKKSFRRATDANRFKTDIEHSLLTGTYVDPRAGRETFQNYAERWRAAQPHRPNTAHNTKSRLHRHIYPVLGARPIAAVRPSEVQALVSGLTLSPGSVRPVFNTLSAIFAAALRDRAIPFDPTDGTRLPGHHRATIVPLTVDQVTALADAMPPRYHAAVIVAAGIGLRQGELFGLQVRDVDFLRKVLRVERQVQPYGVGPLKNRKAYRSIPVGDVVIDALAKHLAVYPAKTEEFIFRTEAGEEVHRGIMQYPWRRARRAVGLPTVGMHDLRHFFASVLIAAGQSVKVVSERLGHSNAAMTLNEYAGLWPEDEDRTRQAVDDAFKIQRGVPRMRPASGSSA